MIKTISVVLAKRMERLNLERRLRYYFFKLANVRKLYDGQTLKRLIETHWSGHLIAIRVRKIS